MMDDVIARCSVLITGTLHDALAALERGTVEIALVVDEDGKLVGVMTDGDVRRALLVGNTLDMPLAPHCSRECVVVDRAAQRADVLELMQARMLGQIPIVDEDRTPVGLHRLHDIIGARPRPNWAVIMAGGLGTRLRPMTDLLPKPMLRIAGRPILERLVLHLVGFGIRRIFLSVNYLGHVIETHFGDGSRYGCRIEYLREMKPLGTSGALSLLPEMPQHPFLVMNGDLVTQANLDGLLDAQERSGAIATIGVRRYFHHVPFGCLTVDNSRVVEMREKPSISLLINAGIYALDPRFVACVPSGEQSFLPMLIDGCLARGDHVEAFEIVDDWVDVGLPAQFSEANGGRR